MCFIFNCPKIIKVRQIISANQTAWLCLTLMTYFVRFLQFESLSYMSVSLSRNI